MGEQLGPHLLAVARKLVLGKRLGTADKLAGDAASRPTVALTMLHCLHLHVLPVFAEGAEDSTVVSRVAIVVSPSFPHTDRCKVRRLQCRRSPLAASIIRDPIQAYFAAAPRLRCRPLDAQVEIPVLAHRVVIEKAGRASRAA